MTVKTKFLWFTVFGLTAGTHPRGAGQVDANWWRDLGESDCFREEPEGGQSLCESPSSYSQRIRWWIWWNEVSLIFSIIKILLCLYNI